MTKTDNQKIFFTISEISEQLDIPSHVLRFWETQFVQIKPQRHNNRRYYTADNIDTLNTIKTLLYNQGYTIEGAKKELKNTSNTNPKQEYDYKKELLAIRDQLKSISTRLKKIITE